MKQIILQILFIAVVAFSSIVHAEDGLSAQGIMAISKISGACGIFDSMIYFQKTTKMSGGDEFVSRFWVAEAARLGLSMQQYSDKCNQAITSYDKLWKAMEAKK